MSPEAPRSIPWESRALAWGELVGLNRPVGWGEGRIGSIPLNALVVPKKKPFWEGEKGLWAPCEPKASPGHISLVPAH